MYAKLAELNRSPFGQLWQAHIAATGIPVHDLWPLQAADGLMDLLDIRNRLAHGRAIPPAAGAPLVYALYHLRWTLERVVLQALAYPIKETDASYEHVAARYSVTQTSLQGDRAALTAAWR